MPIVYLTTNLKNNKKYIGASNKNDPNYFGSGLLIMQAIKKYKKENFKKEIIEEDEDYQFIFDRETFWIKKKNAVESHEYYNLASGGKGGKGTLANPDSRRRCLNGLKKGNKTRADYLRGKKYEEIYEDKADEQRKKRKDANTDVKFTKERCKNMSKARKGKPPWNKGLKGKQTGWSKGLKTFYKSFILTEKNKEKKFIGKQMLVEYIKEINKTRKKGNKINVDALIHSGEYKDLKVKILKENGIHK